MVPAPVAHGPRPDQHVVFAVVTWNVHAGRADLPRFVDDLTQGRLTGFPVRDYAILLQETIAGNKFDVVALAHERQAWVYYTQVRESKQGPSGNAILTTLMPLTVQPIVLPRVRRVRKAIIASDPLCRSQAEGEKCEGFEVACKAERTITPDDQAKGITARVVTVITWNGFDAKFKHGQNGSRAVEFAKGPAGWTRTDHPPVNMSTCADL